MLARFSFGKRLRLSPSAQVGSYRDYLYDGEEKSSYWSICNGLKKAVGNADGYENEATGFSVLQIKDIIAQNAKNEKFRFIRFFSFLLVGGVSTNHISVLKNASQTQ